MATLKKTAKRHARPKKMKATSLLLLYVISKHGGIRAVARETGHSPQLINLWIQKGAVSLNFVGRIAHILDEPTWVFNWEGVASLSYSNFMFEEILRKYLNGNPFERKKILTGELPKSRSELLE